jgi:hypothetical protein
MLEIATLIYIISILFIIETKTISILLYFVLMVISFSLYFTLDLSDTYFFFILIIIYSTAVIILFSFVILLPFKDLMRERELDPFLTSTILVVPFIFLVESIYEQRNKSALSPFIGYYLYNTKEGHIFILLILLLLFLALPGIYYILKEKNK